MRALIENTVEELECFTEEIITDYCWFLAEHGCEKFCESGNGDCIITRAIDVLRKAHDAEQHKDILNDGG